MSISLGRLAAVGLVVALAACSATSGGTEVATPSVVRSTSSAGAATSIEPAPDFPTGTFAALSRDPVPDDVAARLQAALDGMSGRGGIAATVISPEGTWSGAAGTADGVHDLRIDSQFGIGSGTKPIIAAQVMQLVEAGEISLDAPATDYLPPGFTFDTNGATIRQLLSHRSGIPDWYPGMDDQFAVERDRVWTLEEVLALVPATRRPVDGAIRYADTNYNVLGLVIEHVRRRPLADVLRDGVLAGDGVERLIYQPDEAPTDPMAMPRGESRDALEQGGGYLPSLSDASADGAAGAMASDSISLARWWQAFCAGEIVSEASLNQMATLYDDGDDQYGLGLFNPADGYAQGVGHLGANFGYNSWSACLTEDALIVVVLRNFEDEYIFDLGEPLIMAARAG
jgi:D-alanyl-D-alanine carboxypeptidase